MTGDSAVKWVQHNGRVRDAHKIAREGRVMALPPVDKIKPLVSATAYPEGEAETDPRAGDFLLTHAHAWTSRLIRFGERFRYRGVNRPFAYWSHAVAVVSDDGDIVEALGRGVTAGHITKYAGSDYVYVRVQAKDADRAQMAAFAQSRAGEDYGFMTIISIVFSLLTTGRLRFQLAGTEICSGLVARMLERGDYIWDEPASVMPADLARFFDITRPTATTGTT